MYSTPVASLSQAVTNLATQAFIAASGPDTECLFDIDEASYRLYGLLEEAMPHMPPTALHRLCTLVEAVEAAGGSGDASRRPPAGCLT